MSVLNQSGEEQVECPLCMEPLEVDDLHFYPCTCGYQICRFCWNRIREGENGLCPACRKAYPENPADFTPLSQEQVAAIKTEKKAREQKRRNKTLESRRALANVRVVQNNLVFVVGLPVRLADPEILKRQEYFGKYGKIHKVVINQSTSYAGPQVPSASAYVTYVSMADALRAIQGVNNATLDGRVLKGSLGTTKYCANFMKNQPCPKPDCMYLHELGDPKASFTKEEMHQGLHQVYERKLHNQLLQASKEKPDEKHYSNSGNSSTNAEKTSSKDGNPSNFIPTTVVTSSHINVVNSSKSKKESINGNGTSSSGSSNSGSLSGSGSGSGSVSGSVSNSSGSSGNKEAWPSLGSSPPSDSPARKQNSPKPHNAVNKSQENGTSESSSPTQLQAQPNKNKDHTQNHNDTKPTKSTKKSKDKSKQKTTEDPEPVDEKPFHNHSVFDSADMKYLSNELDELESDRHSLLENHELLDSSDHSLLDDDNTHNLLTDAGNEVLMMQRHREMLAGLVENTHLAPQMKSPLVNGYGLIDRDTMSYIGNDRQISQINQGMLDSDMMMRERNHSDMMMMQNEMLARQQHNVMVEPKHYMPTSSIGRESASELLGANYHGNSLLPPFGVRMDNSLPPYLMPPPINVNGFDSQPAPVNVQPHAVPHGGSGRYQAETMDKFFTDFHKAQQLRLRLREPPAPPRVPHNVLSAHALEMHHKQSMSSRMGGRAGAGRAAGDADDDLDFDPFKETQKALAEMMESEMMHGSVSSGDNMERVRRARAAPPGFAHHAGLPRLHTPGTNSGSSAVFSDWTQMDPAIVSTMVGGKAGGEARAPAPHWAPKLPAWPYASIPLPPGFAPPQQPQHPAECIDAK